MSIFGPDTYDPLTIMQNTTDMTYNSQKQSYLLACQNWIALNTDNQNQDRPITPKPTIPQRQVWSRDANGQLVSTWVTELQEPVLPPRTTVEVPSNPIYTTGNAYQDMIINLLLGGHNDSMSIKSDLAAIKAKLGI
jgi:hypothetical protein